MIKIGKIVNTHGIKGELRVVDGPRWGCNNYVDKGYIYIDDEKYEVSSTRTHKKFILITLCGFKDINDVLKFKNKFIMVEGNEIKSKLEPINIIGKMVYFNGKEYSIAKNYMKTSKYFIIIFENDFNIPLTDKYFEYKDEKWSLKRREVI